MLKIFEAEPTADCIAQASRFGEQPNYARAALAHGLLQGVLHDACKIQGILAPIPVDYSQPVGDFYVAQADIRADRIIRDIEARRVENPRKPDMCGLKHWVACEDTVRAASHVGLEWIVQISGVQDFGISRGPSIYIALSHDGTRAALILAEKPRRRIMTEQEAEAFAFHSAGGIPDVD